MVSIENLGTELKVSYIDERGLINIEKIKLPESEMFEWKHSNPKVRIDLIKNCRKLKAHKLHKFRINEFLHQLDPALKNKIFDQNVPKIYFCDIETEILDEFPDPENPQSKILTIAIASEKEQIRVLGLKEITPTQQKNIQAKLNTYFEKYNKKIVFNYIQFPDEYSMLFNFFKTYAKQMPAITGWNFIEFDWKYLVGRAKKLNIDAAICSESKKLQGRDLIPMHKIIFDYLTIYKNWDVSIPIKENHTLDWVSEKALGLRKIKYNGTLTDLYRDDFLEYVYYNAVDSYLVRLIHEKLNTFMPFLKLSQLTQVEVLKAYSPVHMTEMIMGRELLKNDKVLLPPEVFHKPEDSNYAGAYVMTPITGMYSNVACFDYASLYPSIIRQLNISPDVYVGKNIQNRDPNQYIKSVNGCYFKKNEDGILRTILTNLFAERKSNKKKAMEVDTEINYLKKKLKGKK